MNATNTNNAASQDQAMYVFDEKLQRWIKARKAYMAAKLADEEALGEVIMAALHLLEQGRCVGLTRLTRQIRALCKITEADMVAKEILSYLSSEHKIPEHSVAYSRGQWGCVESRLEGWKLSEAAPDFTTWRRNKSEAVKPTPTMAESRAAALKQLGGAVKRLEALPLTEADMAIIRVVKQYLEIN